MSTSDLLFACREAAARLSVVEADMVEVIPLRWRRTSQLVADRLVREIVTGVALRRRALA